MALTTLTKQGCFDSDLEAQVNNNISALNAAIGSAASNTTAPTGTGAVVLATSPTITGLAGASLVAGSITSTQLDPQTIQYVKIGTASITAVAVQNMYTTGIAVLAAQGTGTLIEVVSCFFDCIFGSAAFTSGGAIGLYYGTDHTGVLASGTIAATQLTTFSANQGGLAAGAIAASTATSGILNKGVVLTNATAPFLSGTGMTGILTVAYRVHSGLS